MILIEAVGDGLREMADVLGRSRKVDEGTIRAYMGVIGEDALKPEDVVAACRWFCRDGEGSFPYGPAFRRRCLVERSRRETREANDAYQSRMEAQGDMYADEHDPPLSKEEAHVMIQSAMNRMVGKFKDWPGNEKPRDMKKEIRRMQEA